MATSNTADETGAPTPQQGVDDALVALLALGVKARREADRLVSQHAMVNHQARACLAQAAALLALPAQDRPADLAGVLRNPIWLGRVTGTLCALRGGTGSKLNMQGLLADVRFSLDPGARIPPEDLHSAAMVEAERAFLAACVPASPGHPGTPEQSAPA